jgi:ABC-type transporter Mla subunit MlaD
VELGGGVAGRGQELNAGLAAGRQDLDSLRGIAATLASRDAELRDVIANLDGVTQELARSDRRQELGALIQNLEALLHNLASQEAQLQLALAETNAALTRTANSLDGTGGSLAGIARQLPATVHLADLIMADLGPDSSALLPHMGQLNTAVAEGPSVFGGRDANGFATRATPIVGCATVSLCPSLPNSSAVDFLLGRKP